MMTLMTSLERTDNVEDITNNFYKTYLETYRNKVIDKELLKEICNKINIPLSGDDIQSLKAKIEDKEVMEIIEFLPKGVSPGKDCIMYDMYNLVPEISAKCMAKIGNVIAERGVCPDDFLDNEVALLPKVPDPFHTSMYRPITLTNSDYKIVLRVWANRLGKILSRIIGPHQKGFIPGRDGRENIITVQACIDKMVKNLEGGVMFLDLKKAFDRVSHDALLYMLERFRFPVEFDHRW